MKTLANGAVALAFLLFLYPWCPSLPKLRAYFLRGNHFLLGPLYALYFVLIPLWLRLLLAMMALWVLLTFAAGLAIHDGGLEWMGLGRVAQYLLMGTACFAMAEISVLLTLGRDDALYEVPKLLQRFSPWTATTLPLVMIGFTVCTLNASWVTVVSPWLYRAPWLAACMLTLPIAGILFVRWVTPPPVTSPIPALH